MIARRLFGCAKAVVWLSYLGIIPKVLDIDPFHGRELALWGGAARSAMRGHRSSVATTLEGQFAPPKAALKGRLAALRPACGAPHRGADRA